MKFIGVYERLPTKHLSMEQATELLGDMRVLFTASVDDIKKIVLMDYVINS